MAHEIRMPRLGWTMEEGVFGEWLKAEGEHVAAGDLLYTVEGDKAIQEVEALESGILRLAPGAPRPGDVVPVGAVIAHLLAEGEALPLAAGGGAAVKAEGQAGAASSAATTAADAVTAAAAAPAVAPVNGGQPSPAASPRARRAAAELGIDWRQVEGSGRTGRIVERDVRAAAELAAKLAGDAAQQASAGVGAIRATPVAQRVARAAGIDLSTVSPSLSQSAVGGRIGRSDVEAAIRSAQAAPALEPSGLQAGGEDGQAAPDGIIEPVGRIRRLTAQRMMAGAHDTAPVTLTTEADATELVRLRGQLRAALAGRGRPVPGYNDFLIKIAALALAQHPQLNATWEGEAIRRWPHIDIGLAVDTPDGLLVPVVRDALRRSVGQIAAAAGDLIARAGARQLAADELRGGTFTITNLGMHNIDAFTPIINLPQCAILGIGRIVPKPAVFEGQLAVRHLAALSLTFDHRVVDGAAAARFLNLIREYVTEPALWMME